MARIRYQRTVVRTRDQRRRASCQCHSAHGRVRRPAFHARRHRPVGLGEVCARQRALPRGDLANLVRRLQRSRPSADAPTTRCSRMRTAGDPGGVLHLGERGAHLRYIGPRNVRVSFACSGCFCSMICYSLAPCCVAWASSSSTFCTAQGSAHPSLRNRARLHHRWIFGRSSSGDLCSMRSAHSNAFLDRSACARSSRAARLGRRPHAKQEHRRPAQDADLRIELHADCTVDACQCAHQPPLNAAAAAPQSSRGAFRPLWSRPATRFSRTPSPRARRIRAVQGWFRHSIGQVCVLAHSETHSPARCCSEHCIGGRTAI